MILRLLTFLLLSPHLASAADKPNIILLMGDDHGWEEVGYNDHLYVKTPFLDEMAKSELRLDNFYAQPSCSPARGSFLTGRHPNQPPINPLSPLSDPLNGAPKRPTPKANS